MSAEHILILLAQAEIGQSLARNTLQPAGYKVTLVSDLKTLEDQLRQQKPDLLILGDQYPPQMISPLQNGLEIADKILQRHPEVPVILIAAQPSEALAIQAFRLGVADYLSPPLHASEVSQAVRRALKRRQQLREHIHLEIRRNTHSLQQRVSGLERLQKIGQAITASLDLDTILTEVVDAAVELSAAEEGSLLLLDEASGELYMRAARNFGEDFVRTFRIPAADTLAGEVLRSGQPLLLDEKTPKKIKTAYLVHHLMYVPLTVKGRVIGVLGVDNRQSGQPFSEEHLTLLSALASYAAIAIENARLYTCSEIERQKLETILTKIGDGVIVVDQEKRLILINQAARQAFEIQRDDPIGQPIEALIHHPDLLEILGDEKPSRPGQCEIVLKDGQTFNAQVTPIPEVGLAITMQNITHLKELDRIKSDFVNAVSHDLRSPLTAILGYIELIGRAGALNAQQKEFIRRVENNVHHITALINDLLDLGRIEAGFDSRKEIVPLAAIIHFTLDGQRSRLAEKSQKLTLEVAADLPPVLGNPIHLRQMLANLVGNAIKYTQVGGEIRVSARAESDQVILEVSDNGPGIPIADQPYIFDKFYRASNVPSDTPGTGLGLAIVKSVVDNHQGRIWVESSPGQGTTFIVVLPAAREGT